jgi:hypothetical protein
MQLPRMTTRRMMVMVAVVAVVLTGIHRVIRLYGRWEDHRKWVEYASTEKGLLKSASNLESTSKQAREFFKATGQPQWDKLSKDNAGAAVQYRELADEFARKKFEYQHTSIFLW